MQREREENINESGGGKSHGGGLESDGIGVAEKTANIHTEARSADGGIKGNSMEKDLCLAMSARQRCHTASFHARFQAAVHC